jgi:molybdate-binding protein/DNA-binding transcriptional regulator YhcF (GntR family)
MSRGDFLYHQIAEAIRGEILQGDLKPGDALPSVRQMSRRWDCTPGTVQRAYQELAGQGLVVSRAGRGTRVTHQPAEPQDTPMRRAALVHRAEAFLLEVLTAGYEPDEIEPSVRLALDRWRSAEQRPSASPRRTLRFAGSHDLAVDWLAAHFPEIAPGYRLDLRFTGSLGGLMALAEESADLAGSHLWDEESGAYNLPFVRRLLPGKRVALVTLAHRRLGFILAPGNPAKVSDLANLTRRKVRFVNRQSGSGTRVWLDAMLRRLGLDPDRIPGYGEEERTHSGVARAIAEGRANVGVGLEAAALAYGLEFAFLTDEPYQLVVPAAVLEKPPVRAIVRWLTGRKARTALTSLGGYDTALSGKIDWVG